MNRKLTRQVLVVAMIIGCGVMTFTNTVIEVCHFEETNDGVTTQQFLEDCELDASLVDRTKTQSLRLAKYQDG